MKLSYVLIALLIGIISLSAVAADDNITAGGNQTNTTVNDGNITDVPAAGDNVTNTTSDSTNVTNTTVANVTNDNATANSMLNTGLPVVALILVVLAAVGLYRRD